MSVGQTAGGIIGGVIGAFFENPFLGAQLGMMVGGVLDPPKTPTKEGPRISDLTTQTSTYGAVIPRLYGTNAISGNLIWLENNKIKETATKTKSSGKGGGSKTSTRTYTYSATFAVGLCKGPIVGIRRMWIGPDLVYDAGSSDTATILASNQAAVGWTLYLGSNTQGADPRMQATLGVANTPAYRGLAYLVFEDFALTKYGNSLVGAQVRVEVVTNGDYSSYVVTNGNLPSNEGYSYMAWNGSNFLATAPIYARCLLSSDGLNWTRYNLPETYIGSSICWGAGLFVLGGNSKDHVITSPDGLVWTSRSLGAIYNIQDIKYSGSLFVATTHWQDFLTSSDGITWTPTSHPTTNRFDYVAWNGYIWVATCGTLGLILWSPNGTTWNQVSMPSTGFMRIAANNGIFCVLHSSNSHTCTSSDGITWTEHATTGSLTSVSGLIAIGVSGFLISNLSYNFFTSLDGINWTAHWTGNSQNWVPCFNGAGIARVNSSNVYDQFIWLNLLSVVDELLRDIVLSECLQSSILSAGDIDVASLTPQVRGYSIGTVGTIRSAIEPLQAAWPFDIRQSGYKVQFLLRPGTPVITIPIADLDARNGSEPGVQITSVRESDTKLPQMVTVTFKDYDREYAIGSQFSKRASR